MSNTIGSAINTIPVSEGKPGNAIENGITGNAEETARKGVFHVQGERGLLKLPRCRDTRNIKYRHMLSSS